MSPGSTVLPGIAAIERATLTAVPAPRIAFEGPFVVRAFAGGTGRANAATSLDPAGTAGLVGHVARIEEFYGRLDLPARFRSTPLNPAGLDALLVARGYRAEDESQVIGGPLAGFAVADPDAVALEGPEPAWMEILATAEHQTPARRGEKARMPELLAVPAAWVLLRHDGVAAATAFVTADGPLAGFFDLAVRPEFRRLGLGRRVMAHAAAWAVTQGAQHGYAQVGCGNTASLRLNAGLGLQEHYRYRYFLRR